MKTCIARTYGEVMGEDTCPCWPKKNSACSARVSSMTWLCHCKWVSLFGKVCAQFQDKTAIRLSSYAWCRLHHLVQPSSAPEFNKVCTQLKEKSAVHIRNLQQQALAFSCIVILMQHKIFKQPRWFFSPTKMEVSGYYYLRTGSSTATQCELQPETQQSWLCFIPVYEICNWHSQIDEQQQERTKLHKTLQIANQSRYGRSAWAGMRN